MLSVRNARAVWEAATGEVRDCRDVACSPCAFDDVAVCINATQSCIDGQAAALLDVEVGVTDHRVGLNARGPDQGVDVELIDWVPTWHRDELEVAVGRIRERCVQAHGDTAVAKVLNNPLSGVLLNLRHDLAHRFNELEVKVCRCDVVATLSGKNRRIVQFGDGFNTVEATTHNNNTQRTLTRHRVIGVVSELDAFLHVVAQIDRFFHTLHPDAGISKARDRERLGDRTSGEDYILVRDGELFTVVILDECFLRLMVDADYRAAHELAVTKPTCVRHRDVAWLDRSTHNFREERLIGHVWKRIDDGDDAAKCTNLLLQVLSNVKTEVSTPNNKSAWTLGQLL